MKSRILIESMGVLASSISKEEKFQNNVVKEIKRNLELLSIRRNLIERLCKISNSAEDIHPNSKSNTIKILSVGKFDLHSFGSGCITTIYFVNNIKVVIEDRIKNGSKYILLKIFDKEVNVKNSVYYNYTDTIESNIFLKIFRMIKHY